MATIILFLFIACALSLFVIYPIVIPKTRFGNRTPKSSNHADADLIEQKETIYAAIKDIEFDFQTGKLSEEDFKELRQQYKDEAVQILKKIDKQHVKPARSNQQPAKVGAQKASKSANFCSMCGTAVTESDKFCSNCGNKIN